MPEGGAPEGEDPFAAIQRELKEEAGLTAQYWVAALDMDLSNSITDERAMCWLAWGLEETEVEPDPTEVLVLCRVPFMTLLNEVGRGAVRDSLTVATVYRAYHMAQISLNGDGPLPGELARAMLSA